MSREFKTKSLKKKHESEKPRERRERQKSESARDSASDGEGTGAAPAPAPSTSVESESWTFGKTTCNVSVTNLQLYAHSKYLLRDAYFSIKEEDRICLLGKNGAGKSTFFHWLGTHKYVYECVQELPNTDATLLQLVLSAHLEKGELWARQAELEMKEAMTDEEAKEHNDISDRLLELGSETDIARASKILRGLGFSDTSTKFSELSGGWKARIPLAQGLFMEPRILLLDEPTNHLDLNAVIWLQDYLQSWQGVLVIISHNIGFIREVGNKIWEIDGGRLRIYGCGFYRYQRQKTQDAKAALKAWKEFEKKHKKTMSLKDIQALGEKQGIHRPQKSYNPKFLFSGIDGDEESDSDTEGGRGAGGGGGAEGRERKLGKRLVSLTGASIGYGGVSVLEEVDFSLYEGTRVSVVGENGSGKSTLIKAIVGAEAEIISGELEKDERLKIALFDQHFYHSLPPDETPTSWLMRIKHDETLVRKLLGNSSLKSETHKQKIEHLSGGEKARVYLCKLALEEPDILILDEPTNHLDMETVEALSQSLASFKGALIVISHDCDFLEKTTDEVLMVQSGKVTQLDNIDEYIDKILV
jgi:ATPase subunit of ABC transporter with duplicated ATPase domains